MTAATAPGAARGRARKGASRRKELGDDFGGKSSRCEVALEKPTDVAKARAFVTCSYQTSSSRALVYAKEVEEWGFAPFGVGLLTLTAYACCAAGDDDRD